MLCLAATFQYLVKHSDGFVARNLTWVLCCWVYAQGVQVSWVASARCLVPTHKARGLACYLLWVQYRGSLAPGGESLSRYVLLGKGLVLGHNRSCTACHLVGTPDSAHDSTATFAGAAYVELVDRSLYALNFACELEHISCWKGGRTWLEFGLDGGMFALCLLVMCVFRRHLKPYFSAGSEKSEDTDPDPSATSAPPAAIRDDESA